MEDNITVKVVNGYERMLTKITTLEILDMGFANKQVHLKDSVGIIHQSYQRITMWGATKLVKRLKKKIERIKGMEGENC